MPEAAIARRISRAKQRIKRSRVPFRMPTRAEWSERLRSVLRVLYLVFNEGYAASSGADVPRSDLSGEAIRRARGLHAALPADPEVAGLLALLLLTDARRPARSGPADELIPLAEQDRSLWDRARIEEGVALISAALARGAVGVYQVQAAIAAMVHGPDAGLALLAGLEERLGAHHRLDAVRAHLLEMAGDSAGALAHYRTAAGRTSSIAERTYLTARTARLGPSGA